jgi:uncharacterized membrane protein YidH (DUF202 family)
VVAKFSVWLRELSARLDQTVQSKHSGLSMPLGVALMVLGGLLAVIAGWRYRAVKAAIEEGKSAAAERTMIAVSVVVACVAGALIAYMLLTA